LIDARGTRLDHPLRKLEHQIDSWAERVERSGKEMRHYFTEGVLPFLEDTLEDLKRRLQDLGGEKEMNTLQVKLKDLRRV
jgi:hypothetical protein